jgi:hypothetical protein
VRPSITLGLGLVLLSGCQTRTVTSRDTAVDTLWILRADRGCYLQVSRVEWHGVKDGEKIESTMWQCP